MAEVSSLSAEDHTIDDLDDESLMIRMENLAERMDAIVQRIGSYPDAERDPEYLRLVEQHTAYARVLARRHGFGAEDGSESGDEEFEYPHHDPDWLYEQYVIEGLSAQDIAKMLDVPTNLITRRIHEFELYDVEDRTGRAKSGSRLKSYRINRTKELLAKGYKIQEIARVLGCSDYSVRNYRREIRGQFDAESGDEEVCANCGTTREGRSVLPHRLSRGETKTTRKLGLCYDCDSCYDCCGLFCEPDDVRDDHGFEAESDPVSSVAAGTTDALNDFANSHDTDDKFYFIGGLVGGLAIAVLGNIISDRLQDVYFPHWWDNRGGSSS